MACGNNCPGCKCDPKITVNTISTDRFELEQQILACWTITDEINTIKETNFDPKLLEAVIVLYELKFEKLWSIFETLVNQKKIL